LATMPPTFAAARRNHRLRAACRQTSRSRQPDRARSTSRRPGGQQFSRPSCASLRTSAEADHPSMPGNEDRFAFQLKRGFLPLGDPPRLANRKIARHHLLDELGRTSSSAPSQASGAPCWRSPIRRSTSVGRKILGIDANDRLGRIFLSTPVSSTPWPCHSMLRPTSANAISANSRTERVSPVRQHEIVGRRPACRISVHAFDIIPGVAPSRVFAARFPEIERGLRGRSRCGRRCG